jgi:O-acetyl-ADP-ribose deacetylase (regulator of RNase III)
MPKNFCVAEDELLARCYRSCFALAKQHALRTIAFPSISTGAYGFPVERAARIAVTEIRNVLEKDTSVEKVILVCFDKRTYDCYSAAVTEVLR